MSKIDRDRERDRQITERDRQTGRNSDVQSKRMKLIMKEKMKER